MQTEGRHPATVHLAKTFAYEHLPPHLLPISKAAHDLAAEMLEQLPDGAELSAGLRKLREAKDCFVLARVIE